ncbi:hypothetical protein MHU86_1324 [Fragilaria crotonensis]|nr:hypothetical protein MHU86_1324 [Fragilaria crotonensis]
MSGLMRTEHGIMIWKVNITRPSNAIKESNQFRKRHKGVEFTIIRTKGDARAGDVSSEDEDPGDSEQEADSDNLEPPEQEANVSDDQQEPHAYYCRRGFYLSGRRCAKCDIEFVSALSKNGFETREV